MAQSMCCSAGPVSIGNNRFLSAILDWAKTVIDVRFSTRLPPFLATSRHFPHIKGDNIFLTATDISLKTFI